MKKSAFVLLWILIPGIVFAQLYRPSLNWYELNSKHFRVIFHEGNDSLARASTRILEAHYAESEKLTGGSLHRFPVVLNAYNDRSNGYVTPFNFRMEVEIPYIKGKILNPRSGGWLENVLPHELIHAQHFSVIPTVGVSGLIYPFWPDGVRSLHFMAPVGFHEGLAVHYESEIITNVSGRGNHPYFTNQINSIFSGYGRWSLGEMLQPVTQTLPYDRHYQGGYEFISWVQRKHGHKTARDILDFMGRWPFMGYGFAYWYQTKQWPGTAYKQYETDKIAAERNRQEQIRAMEVISGERLDSPFKGEFFRRPLWLNKQEALVFGQFYDEKAGYFLVDVNTATLKRLFTGNIVEDAKMDLKPDKSAFLFARYDVHPIYDNTFITHVYEYDFKTKRIQKVGISTSENQRVFNPIYVDDVVWAFQTAGSANRLVQIDSIGVQVLMNPGIQTLMDMDYAEETGKLALVANVNGAQGIWISKKDDMASILDRNPDILFQSGSIYDPHWSKDGSRLLFTSDHTGTMNVYEYQAETKKIFQLTNTLFNAFEASYSVDEQHVLFVVQHENEQQLAKLDINKTQKKEISRDIWANQTVPKTRKWQSNNMDIDTLSVKRHYSSLTWLRPRGLIPNYKTGTYGNRISAFFLGTDILQRHTWSADLASQYGEFWYDISYRFTGFWPGFELRAYKDDFSLEFQSGVGFMAESGYALAIPFRINLENNIYFSSVFIKPELKFHSYELAYASTDVLGRQSNLINQLVDGRVWTFRLLSQLNYKLIQRVRDFQPAEGVVLFAQADVNLNDNPLYNLFVDSNDNPLPEKRQVGVIGGINVYLPSFIGRNQSLRLGAKVLYQPQLATFDVIDFIWDAGAANNYRGFERIFELSSRYTLPFAYPETGGFLIPWYIQNLYGVLFTRTHFDLSNDFKLIQPNTMLGAGIRYTTGVGNLRIDLGVSYIYNTSNRTHGDWVGDF